MTNKDISNMSLEELRDHIKNNPFLRSNKWGEILADKSANIEKRISKIEEEQKKTKLIVEKEEIKEIFEASYKELAQEAVKDELKEKKGIFNTAIHKVKKYFGLTTAGAMVIVLLGIGGGVLYVKNKTDAVKTLDAIQSYQKITQEYKKKIEIFEKKYFDEDSSLKKSIDDMKANYDNSINKIKEPTKNNENLEKKSIEHQKEGDNKEIIYNPEK